MASLKITLDFDAIAALQEKLRVSDKTMLRACNSGLSSVSYFFQQRLKSALKTNRFGFPSRKEYSPTGEIIQKVAVLRPPRGGKRGRGAKFNENPWGAMYSVLRYMIDKTKLSSEIGVIEGRPSLEYKAMMIQQDHLVTERNFSVQSSRAYFAAVGMPLRRGTVLRAQGRPLFGPVWEEGVEEANTRMMAAVQASLLRYLAGGEKT